jgi:hypothetical protein
VATKSKANNLEKFTVVNSLSIDLVSNGAKVNISGESSDDSWVSLDVVVISCEALKSIIEEAYNLRKV